MGKCWKRARTCLCDEPGERLGTPVALVCCQGTDVSPDNPNPPENQVYEPHQSSIRSTGRERPAATAVQMTARMQWHGDTNLYTTGGDTASERHAPIEGMFVATEELHPVGTAVALRMLLPDGASAWVRGRVDWLREGDDDGECSGLGVRFTWLSTIAAAELMMLARRRPPMVHCQYPAQAVREA